MSSRPRWINQSRLDLSFPPLPFFLHLSSSLAQFLGLSHTEAAGDSFVLLINDENHILHNTSKLNETGNREKEHQGPFIPIKFHSGSNSFWALFVLSAIQTQKAPVGLLQDALFFGRYGDCSWLVSRRGLVFPVFRVQPLPRCYGSSMFQIIVHQQQLQLVVASILTSCLRFVLHVHRNTFKDRLSETTAGTGLALISDVCDVGVCGESSIYLHNSWKVWRQANDRWLNC